MKKIYLLLAASCIFLMGFDQGFRSGDIYLADNESIYISQHDGRLYVWVYTLDQTTGQYSIELVSDKWPRFESVTVHFIDTSKYSHLPGPGGDDS